MKTALPPRKETLVEKLSKFEEQREKIIKMTYGTEQGSELWIYLYKIKSDLEADMLECIKIHNEELF